MVKPARPVVTMSTLGEKGRFGNQIFQYAFLKIYAKVFNLTVQTPEWIGQYLFGHNDPPITRKLPVIFEEKQKELAKIFTEPVPRYKNVDFFGYYQFHTTNFTPYKDYFQSLFKPTPIIEAAMKKGLDRLCLEGKTIVALHIRRGDYGSRKYLTKGKVFFIAPIAWYKNWLGSIWAKLDNPVLFIASDEIDLIAPKFSEYHPIISQDLYGSFPKAGFYPDFYLLTQCDVMAISNSTFSFTASMLNQKARSFIRPDLDTKRLITYDPWASPPLLNRFRSYY